MALKQRQNLPNATDVDNQEQHGLIPTRDTNKNKLPSPEGSRVESGWGSFLSASFLKFVVIFLFGCLLGSIVSRPNMLSNVDTISEKQSHNQNNNNNINIKNNNSDNTGVNTSPTTASKEKENAANAANGANAVPDKMQENKTKTKTKTKTKPLILPNLLFIGAQKSGTTAIAKWLFENYHLVCQPKRFPGEDESRNKEVHFFDDGRRFRQGVKFYARRFEHCANIQNQKGTNPDTKIQPIKPYFVIDSTPDYFDQANKIISFYEQVLTKTTKTSSSSSSSTSSHSIRDLKIFLILREPVARELSWYNHMASYYTKSPDPTQYYAPVAACDDDNNGQNKTQSCRIKTFDEYVDQNVIPDLSQNVAPNFSLYAKRLKEWFEALKEAGGRREDQLLILSYDELKSNETRVLERLIDFLDPSGSLPWNTRNQLEVRNQNSFSSKVAKPSCVSRDKLQGIFERSNEELYDLLEHYAGPWMEQKPFPRFSVPECED